MEITPASTGMYLALTTGDAGRELFYSPDGVTGDFVKDLAFGSASSWPSGIFTVGNRAFFRADDGADNNISTTTYSLFVTDGDAATTVRLTSPISQIATDAFVGFGAYGTSGVLFTMNDPTTGIEIWRSDGTPVGTKNVADIYPGTGSSSPAEMTLMGGYYYFGAGRSTASCGEPTGTRRRESRTSAPARARRSLVGSPCGTASSTSARTTPRASVAAST